MNYEEVKNLALESGFTHAAPLDTATIELKQDVRDMCAQGCQQYAKHWSLSSWVWNSGSASWKYLLL